ncbi:MAG: glycerophosphodiester phosphodiesterase [Chloroflexota bacterium]
MGQAPENTLASFSLALKLGADAIELDVHLSQDGEVVVIHDDRLERTTNGRGLVRDFSFAELKRLDAGSHFNEAFGNERIPSLGEVFEVLARRVPVFVEIKNNPMPYAGIEQRVIQAAREAGMLDQIQIISFDHPTVKRTREACSDVATAPLYIGRPLDAVSIARAAGASALGPHWSSVQALDVRLAHRAGLSVHPWTTSDPAVVRQLLAMDVDSITTNHPDRVAEALGRKLDDSADQQPGARTAPELLTVHTFAGDETD